MIRVTENLKLVSDLLAEAAKRSHREPSSVRLLAVSKGQPVRAILEAHAAGQREFGENQVQEGVSKIAELAAHSLCWHFIGNLQTNKTRTVAGHFDWVHSIDRLKVARRLSDQRPECLSDLNVCLQVNIDSEESKSGVAPEDVRELAFKVTELPRLTLRGLMCLPAIRNDSAAQRQPFARLRAIFEALNAEGLGLDTLSMGMSNDFEAAVKEGATIVRVGSAIFGPRNRTGTDKPGPEEQQV